MIALRSFTDSYYFPPGAFYMVGDIESARAKGEKILAELEQESS